jgi:hypothetical protein
MTASEQPPGDDTALLTAALNQAWAQYDAEINRGVQVVNYYVVATAVVATAYVGAINGSHYLIAAVLALSEATLTTVTFLIWLRQREAAHPSLLALRELQGRVDTRMNMETVHAARAQPGTARGRLAAPVTVGLALAADIAALLYAVTR